MHFPACVKEYTDYSLKKELEAKKIQVRQVPSATYTRAVIFHPQYVDLKKKKKSAYFSKPNLQHSKAPDCYGHSKITVSPK